MDLKALKTTEPHGHDPQMWLEQKARNISRCLARIAEITAQPQLSPDDLEWLRDILLLPALHDSLELWNFALHWRFDGNWSLEDAQRILDDPQAGFHYVQQKYDEYRIIE